MAGGEYMSADVERLERENADLRALFEMQWRRMGEATDRWRAEDPEARALVMPDLGDLLQWLMGDADRLRTTLGAIAAYADERREALDAGTGLAHAALAAIANTARQAAAR
jgi:hypothetical protein